MTTPSPDYEVLIRESYLDSFGHMNNAAYLVLFEEARWDFITQNGYGLKKVRELQQGPIVLELSMKFRKEIILRERIRITTVLTDYRGKIGHLHQEMLKDDDVVAAELDITIG